jgi:nucleoside-diphosphate-sugar epimerase
MTRRKQVLVVGAGNVGARILWQLRAPSLSLQWHATALVRSASSEQVARRAGARILRADLDDAASLRRALSHRDGLRPFDAVIQLAPPPGAGTRDLRTRRLLRAIVQGRRGRTAQRLHFVYVSTSGVYGDCAGAEISEAQPLRPFNARALRRVDAESVVRRNARREGWHATVLRAPGIYDAQHLPLDRIRAGTPAIVAHEDSYTNHIHAEDLARLCIAALRSHRTARVYNASDDSSLRMGDWFDLVADTFGLARPPRLSRAEVRAAVSPMMWSFMRESRQLRNARMKRELRVRLHFPTVREGLMQALQVRQALVANQD